MTLPQEILAVIQPFSKVFSQKRSWYHAQLLLFGLILLKGGRTVCRILRLLGLKSQKKFDKYHKLLNRSRMNLLQGSKMLLEQAIAQIPEKDTIYIAIDEHLERRRGSQISAIGCYRDPVLSTKRNKVKSFGLKWITVMLLTKFTWSEKIFALPFLTILTKSVQSDRKAGVFHKTVTNWLCQIAILLKRWIPHRRIVMITDGGLASSEFGWTCLRLGMHWVSRLQYNARLYDFPEETRKKRGRPTKKGRRLFSPREMHQCPDLEWQSMAVKWYGNKDKSIEYVSFTCLRHTDTSAPYPIRVVLLRDPKQEFESISLMGISRDCSLSAKEIVEAFVSRWNQEVTHREVREHLGVETQRQWSDKAISRCTPILFGLYTLVLLISDKLTSKLVPQQTAWYKKTTVTFSDALTAVRKEFWKHGNFIWERFKDAPNKNSELQEDSALFEYLAEVI